MSKIDTAKEGANTKLCHIVKRANFDGYGFNLHSEKVKPGQYIGKVDENSPAESAGLREGDRIIEVNGVAIGNATHKQVVQRIKAISNEVRLLLLGEPETVAPENPTAKGSNGVAEGMPVPQGTKLEMPGVSANISSISVVATKRTSITSSGSGSRPNSPNNGRDEMDRATTTTIDEDHHNGLNAMVISESNNNNNNNNKISNNKYESALGSLRNTTTPTVSTPARLTSSATGIPVPPPVVPPSSSSRQSPESTNDNNNTPPSPSTSSMNSATMHHNDSMKKTGGLQLPTTAAEMRAKLLSKKKYDPKSEGVDLKKKFEIIQKL